MLYDPGTEQVILDDLDADPVRETGYELYYRIQVTPWFQITPDLRTITNPAAPSDNDHADVPELRARAAF